MNSFIQEYGVIIVAVIVILALIAVAFFLFGDGSGATGHLGQVGAAIQDTGKNLLDRTTDFANNTVNNTVTP